MTRLLHAIFFGCEVCGSRKTCIRGHVEVLTCPTCKQHVSEFQPAFSDVVRALATPVVTWQTPNSGSVWQPGGATYTWNLTGMRR